MKLNINSKDCRYIVDKDKRKVVCIIDNTDETFIAFMNKNFKVFFSDDGPYWGSAKFEKKLSMPRRFVGIATCGDTDEWNEETGKLIAYSRAKDNFNKSFFKRANLYVNTIDNEVERATEMLNMLGQKLTTNTARRHEKISALIGEE